MGERRVGRGTRNQDLKDESILGCCSHDCSQARTDRRIIGDACGSDQRSTQSRVPSVRGGSRASMGKREGWSKLVSCPPFSHPPHHSCRSREKPCSCLVCLKTTGKDYKQKLLGQWLSKCVHSLSKAAAPENWSEIQDLGIPTQDLQNQKLWRWSSALGFNEPSPGYCYAFKFDNHCIRKNKAGISTEESIKGAFFMCVRE